MSMLETCQRIMVRRHSRGICASGIEKYTMFLAV